MADMEINYTSRKKSMGSLSRVMQAASGLFLIFFVGVHLYVAHIDFGHPIQFFAQVIQNMHNLWWLAFFIAFVWVISYHAVNGLGGVIKDITMTKKVKSYVNIFLLALFMLTGIYGTILAILVSVIT